MLFVPEVPWYALFEVRDTVVAKIKSTTNFLHFTSDLDT